MSRRLVIIPTYNEIENIERIIRNVFSQRSSFDILVVDDSSPDQTAAKVKELQREFSEQLFLEVRTEKSGLGTAYIHGFKWALARDYDFIFEMDADFSHNPKDLVRIHEKLNDFDLVVGSRYVEGINVVNWPLSRIILSYFASIYSRLITGMPIKDATSGFVGYRSKVLESINLESLVFNGYAFQIELKFKSYIKKFRLTEIPIIFKDRVYGDSKMNGSIIFEAVFGLISMKMKSLLKD